MRGKIVIAILVLSILGGYYLHLSFKNPLPSQRLVIAEACQPVFALLYIAEEKGYFKEEGLDVITKRFTSGRDALANVLAGEADLATVYETPVVLRTYEGQKLGIVSALHTSTKNTALVVRKDRGIFGPGDLVGKKIAVPKNTNAEFFLFLYLTSEGIALSDVEFVDTKPEDIVSLFREGTVDAVAVWNLYLYAVQQALEEEMITTFYSDVYTEFSVLVGLREFIEENKETMQKILRAIVKAERFFLAHKEEAKMIVAKRLPDFDEKTVLANWDAFTPTTRLDNVMLMIFKQEALWFKNAGMFQTPVPDFRKVIITDYLKSVDPEAVTIL